MFQTTNGKAKIPLFNSIMEDSNTGMASLKLKQVLFNLKTVHSYIFLGTSFQSIVNRVWYFVCINHSQTTEISFHISDM